MTLSATTFLKTLKTIKLTFLLAFTSLGLMTSCGGESTEVTPDSHIEQTVIDESTELTDNAISESTTMDPRSFGGDKSEDQVYIDEQSSFYKTNPVLGMYVGSFGKNMINIVITYADKGNATGYSVCAGNFRRLTGTYLIADDGLYEFKLEEPGDDQYDGAFEFIANGEDLSGKWTPFKKEGNSAKDYSLAKRVYSFNTNNGDHPEASTRLLTDDDVNNLNSEELGYMRNCIYARHGYSFKDKTWRYTFEELDWYMPTCIDVRDKLSDTEVANIELIYDYETYFEMYYDDYGR